MVNQEHLSTLEREGLVVIPKVLPQSLQDILRQELELAIAEDLDERPNTFDKGMIHNCMARGEQMAALLDNKTLVEHLNACFSNTCIVYAYQSSSLPPIKNP